MNKFSTSLVYFCVIFSAILLLGSYQNVEAFAVQNGRREIKDSMFLRSRRDICAAARSLNCQEDD
ncbi:unnamed protein product [Porites evermanni]|uniref:Uncharacterized protein n=1 Tax=Porites evermanni TaxID=104178 RepID=A0ABN8MHQ6_9CNID|nr:unnamed protein product [Porites evermanni]